MLFWLYTIVCFSGIHAHGQVNLDSLKTALSKSKLDSLTILQVLERTIHTISPKEMDAHLMVFDWALKGGQKLNNAYIISCAIFNKGQCYASNFENEKASSTLIKALNNSEKYHLTDLKLKVLAELGALYANLEQYEKAEEYYLKCLSIKGTEHLFTTYTGLAVINYYKKESNKKRAFAYMLKAIHVVDTTHIDGYENLAYAYSNMCQFQNFEKQYDSCLYYLAKLKPILKPSYTDPNYSYDLYRGRALKGKQNYAAAITSFNQGLLLVQKQKAYDWIYVYFLELSNTYKETHNYALSLHYIKQYQHLHDSLINVENFAKAADIQNKYEREKKQKQFIQLKKNNEIKQLVIDKDAAVQKRLFFVLATIILIVLLLLVFGFVQAKNIRTKRLSYNLLQQKNIHIQEQAEKIAQQSKLISKHQTQMTPHFMFNAIHNIQGFVLADEKNKSIEQLNSFSTLMRKTIRNAEKELVSVDDEVSYLKQYVQFEQQRFSTPFKFNITLPKKPDNVLLPPMLIQPFIENAIKHAGLNIIENACIEVSFYTDEWLHIQITDNGKGFIVDEKKLLQKSHALSIVLSRIQLLYTTLQKPFDDTAFSLSSSPGKGTLVKLKLPIVLND